MPNQSLAKVPSIDPEFAAVYAEAESVPRRPDPTCAPTHSEVESEEDPLLALKRIAEKNAAASRASSECEDGFDRVENDVSKVCKTLFDFVTR